LLSGDQASFRHPFQPPSTAAATVDEETCQPFVINRKKFVRTALDNAFFGVKFALSQTSGTLVSPAIRFERAGWCSYGIQGCRCVQPTLPPGTHKSEKVSYKEKKMKVKPLNDRVLVVRVEEEKKTAGGIIIPDTAKEKPMQGKVIAAGPGKLDEKGKRIPMVLKQGERVLFSKYAGTEIKIDGVEHLFMREDDILGVIE
jgi:chaperonin GroES